MIETNKVVLLFGKICSGKSTYADALCYVTKAKRITVSDIVKRVSGKVSRSELQGTAHMDREIALELIAEIKKYDKVVIDGIRQLSIVVELAAEFGQEELSLIWLEVPDDIRKYRFYDRSISKDDITFEEADARDEKLGLKLLAESLKDSYIIINN
jgi:dephospho-CoA kinase